jgi:hypothetical protein
MRECRDCNYSTDDGICLHESARDPSGTHPNLSTCRKPRLCLNSRHCGREGRFWQARALVWPSAPTEG